MSNPGMDADIFEHFIDQLKRYVRDRLLPAEAQVIAHDACPRTARRDARDGPVRLPCRRIRRLGDERQPIRRDNQQLSLHAGVPFDHLDQRRHDHSALVKSGTDEQKAKWLPRSCSGRDRSFGLTEPELGFGPRRDAHHARRARQRLRLNGTKRYITNAPWRKWRSSWRRTETGSAAGNAHVSAFLVPMDARRRIGSPDKKMGQSRRPDRDIVFEDVPGAGRCLARRASRARDSDSDAVLDNGRLSVAAAWRRHAERLLDYGGALRHRTQAFGEPIAEFQLIQAMLADSQAEIYAAKCMMRDAGRRADAGEHILAQGRRRQDVLSEMCGRVADRCVQVHGGAGYLREYDGRALLPRCAHLPHLRRHHPDPAMEIAKQCCANARPAWRKGGPRCTTSSPACRWSRCRRSSPPRLPGSTAHDSAPRSFASTRSAADRISPLADHHEPGFAELGKPQPRQEIARARSHRQPGRELLTSLSAPPATSSPTCPSVASWRMTGWRRAAPTSLRCA